MMKTEKIANIVKEVFHADRVEVVESFKENLKLKGYRIIHEESYVSPVIYLDEMIDAVMAERNEKDVDVLIQDGTIEEHVRRIKASIDEDPFGCDDNIPEMQSILTRKEKLLAHVTPYLINAELNKELLGQLVSSPFAGDVSVIYEVRFLIGEGKLSSKITMEQLARLGITKEELHWHAVENLDGHDIEHMAGVLEQVSKEIDGSCDERIKVPPVGPSMYVVGTKTQTAAAILSPETLRIVQGIYGEEFFVLPSSNKEVILLPYQENMISHFKMMVHEVNSDVLHPADFLSDHLFAYRKGEFVAY